MLAFQIISTILLGIFVIVTAVYGGLKSGASLGLLVGLLLGACFATFPILALWVNKLWMCIVATCLLGFVFVGNIICTLKDERDSAGTSILCTIFAFVFEAFPIVSIWLVYAL